MGKEDKSYKGGRRKKGSFNGDLKKKVSGRVTDGSDKYEYPMKHQKSIVRYEDLII